MTYHAVESLEKLGQGKIYGLEKLFDDFPATQFAESAIKDGLKIEEPRNNEIRALFLDHLVDRLLEKIGGSNDVHVVLKTHLPCTPNIARGIATGMILASATFRHPAEMILSRNDMSRRDGEVLNEEDIKYSYKVLINEFYTWANLAKVKKYYYDDIASNPRAIMNDIYNHVGSNADFRCLLDEYLKNKKEKIVQFNKGVMNRASHEMKLEDISKIEEFFSDFMEYIRLHKLKKL